MRHTTILLGILAYSLTICCAATEAAADYKPTPLRPVHGIDAPEVTSGPDVGQDIKDLTCALHADAKAKPVLVAEAPCSGPGVYKDGAKNECVILDYTAPTGKIRAMLYYPQLRGKEPKPAKMFYHDGIVWITVERPRSC